MNGRKIKDRMRSQWEYKRKSFELSRKANQLIMTVNDQMDRNDFRKDLPSHVIDDVRQDRVIMWLDKPEEFFGIPFSSRSRFAALAKRFILVQPPPERRGSAPLVVDLPSRWRQERHRLNAVARLR